MLLNGLKKSVGKTKFDLFNIDCVYSGFSEKSKNVTLVLISKSLVNKRLTSGNLKSVVSQSYLTLSILACGLSILPTKAYEIAILSSLIKFKQILSSIFGFLFKNYIL